MPTVMRGPPERQISRACPQYSLQRGFARFISAVGALAHCRSSCCGSRRKPARPAQLPARRLEGLPVRGPARPRPRGRALLHARQGRHPPLGRPRAPRREPRLPDLPLSEPTVTRFPHPDRGATIAGTAPQPSMARAGAGRRCPRRRGKRPSSEAGVRLRRRLQGDAGPALGGKSANVADACSVRTARPRASRSPPRRASRT
jgi:hypothetical protein